MQSRSKHRVYVTTQAERMIYYSWSVFWGNPYTDPPNGEPRYLMDRVIIPGVKRWSSRNCPPCVDMLIDHLRAKGEYGWSIGCTCHDTKAIDEFGRSRVMSEAGKQSLRRNRLKRRLERKYPLFCEQWYAEAIAAKPEYYGTP